VYPLLLFLSVGCFFRVFVVVLAVLFFIVFLVFFVCVLSLGTCVIFNCLRVSAGSQLGYKNLLICSAAYSIHTYIQTQPLHHPQSLFSPQNKRNFLLISLQAGMKQKRKGNPKTIFGPANEEMEIFLFAFSASDGHWSMFTKQLFPLFVAQTKCFRISTFLPFPSFDWATNFVRLAFLS